MDESIGKIIARLKFPIILVVLMWASELFETFTGQLLSRNGIYPRELDGILGILFSPFIHSDFEHLLSNTVPLFVLTTIMIFFYRRVAIPAFFFIQVLTGFAVWLFARPSYHIGASGVVYGLVAFVFWSGVFRRNVRSIILALIVVIMYSGYFYGILPNKEGVSWESHLFGGIVGIFTAFLFKNIKEPDEEEINPWLEEEEEETTYFLPRDTFEKTKKQRLLEQQRIEQQERWTKDDTFGI